MDALSLSQRFASAGVEGAAALARRLLALCGEGDGVSEELAQAVGEAADPELCVAQLERLTLDSPGVLASLEPNELGELCTVLGGSEHLGAMLARAPAWLEEFRRAREGTMPPAPAAAGIGGFSELQRLLRRRKAQSIFSIGVRDLLGLASLEETMRKLSELAESCVETAVHWVRSSLAAEYGEVMSQESEGQTAAFVVLGMGKLGGFELNYSSDIDLVYIFESDRGESGGGGRGKLDAREFFTRMAEEVTRALNAVTEEGRAFRVDLRLRPDGVNGPVANSIAGALAYYESYGQTWERSVLVRARPVAGSKALGKRFLEEIGPFVYRRYLDFTTVEDMKEMKAKIEASLSERGAVQDVKLGRGGIREIEFVAHTLQLVHGGKDKWLRHPSTLETIERLVARGHLQAESGERLARAYRFLRNVEHKIQLLDQRQTQRLPAGRGEVALARRLRYHLDGSGRTSAELARSAVSRFQRDLAAHTEFVHDLFASLFYSPAEEIKSATDRSLALLLDELEQEERALWKLQELGFRDTEGAYRELKLLRDGPARARSTPRRRKLLRQLAPALLGEIGRSADPDRALRNLARFLTAAGARSTFLSLLLENPETMRLLVRLFGTSEYLSNFLIAHPELLDALVRADLAKVMRDRTELSEALSAELQASSNYEEALNALRRIRNEEVLRIGLNEINGALDCEAVSAQLSDLAEICLVAAVEIAAREILEHADGDVATRFFAIIGMGKLGSRELTYNSDLDLIFIYDDYAGDRGEGARDSHILFTKLAQKIITTLQAPTREGVAYRIDTRLRPSGKSGPLVCSLQAFASYHAKSSQIWERQALIKARVVFGEPGLRRRIEEIVERFVYGRSLEEHEAAEIHRIRMRMEKELAREKTKGYNIKLGRGGLVDIEFVVQMLQLRFGQQFAGLRVRATREALERLAQVGVLPPEDAAELADSWAFLRAVESALRIERDKAVEELETETDRVASVARRLGYEGEPEAAVKGFLSDYRRRRDNVRALYEKWFELAT